MLGDAVILMADGQEKPCRELYTGDNVHALTNSLTKIVSVFVGMEEQGIRIVTDRGQKLTLSVKNALLTTKGPKLVKDIRPRDLLLSNHWGESEVSHIYVDPIYEKVYRVQTDKPSWIYVNGIAVGDLSIEKELR